MKTLKVKMFNYVILCLGITLSIVSCDKDSEIIEQQKKETNQIKVEKINIENLKKEKEIFNEISQNLDIISSRFSARNTKQNDKIIVLTDKILKTTKNNIITYSFMLEKPTSNFSDIENLMIFKYPNGDYKFSIIQYKYTQNIDKPYIVKIKKISASEFKKFDYNIKYAERYKAGGIEFDDCIDVSYECPYGGTTEHGSNVCGPNGIGPGSTMFIDVSNCFDDSSIPGFDINNPGLNPDNGNNSHTPINTNTGMNTNGQNGSNTNVGGGTGTAVLCMDTDNGCIRQYHIELEFLLNITDQKLLDYLKQNRDFAEEILNFYEENKQDDFLKEFCLDAIKNTQENPNTEIDFENKLIYNPNLNQDYTYWMTSPEKLIFKGLNNSQKLGYLKSAQQAKNYSKLYYKNTYKNGNGDALRHAFWNALSTVYIGEDLTKKLTDAHEAHGHSLYKYQIKEKPMDLYNNNIGRKLAYRSGKLFEIVENALKNGELRKLSNLDSKRRPTKNSKLIPTN